MHRHVRTGWLPVLLVASVTAEASSVVTETEFLAFLDASHPAALQASESVAAARGRVVAAATLENPTLSVVREDPSGPAEQLDWTLSWQLPGSDRRRWIEAGEGALAAAEAQQSMELLALRLAMREIYADWAVNGARRARLALQVERVERLARREAARAEKGEASGLAARRLDLAVAVLRSRLALADADTEAARTRAAAWAPELPPDARSELPLLPEAIDAAGDPPRLGASPRLRAAQADLAAALLEQQAARHFVRSPEVQIGWQAQETAAESLDGPIVGLAWSVPIFARGQAARALAESRVSAARSQLELVRRESAAARSSAGEVYSRHSAAVEQAESAVAGNERLLAAAEVAFRHGETTLTDLLDTLRAMDDAEMAVLDLYAAALAANRELERQIGSGAVAPSPDSNPVKE
ncbi:MAG: TolC family protein [Acidobacteriota bacterium]